MRVRVLFFGRLKEIVGQPQEDVEIDDGARLEDLFTVCRAHYPKLGEFRSSVVAAVNQGLAAWESPLAAGDEVAFLPPVSGGAGESAVATRLDKIELIHTPIPVAEIVEELKAPEYGATVAFEGIVRN